MIFPWSPENVSKSNFFANSDLTITCGFRNLSFERQNSHNSFSCQNNDHNITSNVHKSANKGSLIFDHVQDQFKKSIVWVS